MSRETPNLVGQEQPTTVQEKNVQIVLPTNLQVGKYNFTSFEKDYGSMVVS